jgi:hypothetical protein
MQWTETIGRSVQGTYKNSLAPSRRRLRTCFIPNCARSRRICPGIHVAERELWLAISRLLWAYDIRPLPEEPISLDGYAGASSRKPEPYRVTLTPRHDRVQALLEGEEEVTLMIL